MLLYKTRLILQYGGQSYSMYGFDDLTPTDNFSKITQYPPARDRGSVGIVVQDDASDADMIEVTATNLSKQNALILKTVFNDDISRATLIWYYSDYPDIINRLLEAKPKSRTHITNIDTSGKGKFKLTFTGKLDENNLTFSHVA